MPDTFGYISADLGKTWTAMPANCVTIEYDTICGPVEYFDGGLRCTGTVTMRIKKLHIGAFRELLGDGYQEFRRYTLSRRKHEHGRWRA